MTKVRGCIYKSSIARIFHKLVSLGGFILSRVVSGTGKTSAFYLTRDTGRRNCYPSSLCNTYFDCGYSRNYGIHSSFTRDDINQTGNENATSEVMKRNLKEIESITEDEGLVINTSVYNHVSDNGVPNTVSFEITWQEKELFDLLTSCVSYHSLNIELRVAGGWVRDKLLKASSKDIDVAVEKMTGLEFCNYLNAFTKDKLGFERTVGIVKKRPEQSKHLETATISILGFSVDFVNLRCEDYAKNSRIPTMKIGTPFEDAMRRDFTINSLFYNITRNTVEDYTGYGIRDLASNIIRTCSPALSTFIDDPLRVIRAARFSARLDYDVHEDISQASSSKEVLDELRNKVSKSRIAQELDDVLSRGNVPKAFELMRRWGVLSILVRDDAGNVPSDKQMEAGCKTIAAVNECLNEVEWGVVDRKLAYIAALFYPIRDEPRIGKITHIEHLIKERLKLPNKLATGAAVIVEGSDLFEALLQEELPSDIPALRGAIARVIRAIGTYWKESLLLSMANEAMESSQTMSQDLKSKYANIMKIIEDLHLYDAYLIKAPITGNELMSLLPGLKPGPEFKKALDFQVDIMLTQPDITREELRSRILESLT